MGRQGRMEKKNKTLGTGSCENIDIRYINKIIVIIFIAITRHFIDIAQEKP